MNDTTPTGSGRGAFGSKMGFVLAAAGSAIGLGNIWKFPYITGENGGGAFVLVYLICIALVGLPLMIGEVMLGRATQKSPVGAFKELDHPKSRWRVVGGMGVLAAFFMLSYYSVVAGWGLHYTSLAIQGGLEGADPATVKGMFGSLVGDVGKNLQWHVVFMVITIGVVIGGVHKGIERCANVLMPALFLMLCVLLFKSSQMEGFSKGFDFVFGARFDKLTPAAVLEALGHSFFTLSLGMGAMLTYGSYLKKDTSLFANSFAICFLDTLIALMACMILFPITFTYGMQPQGGPGLVFQNIPIAMSQMPGGGFLSIVFFALIVFAALTSAVSLLEVVASYFIDERNWSRPAAVITCGTAILLFGVPSAMSGGSDLFGAGRDVNGVMEGGFIGGRSWFDSFDYLVSNWMLPLGGLLISLFVAWRLEDGLRRTEFVRHSRMGKAYWGWVMLLKWFIPCVIIVVFLHAIGVIEFKEIPK